MPIKTVLWDKFHVVLLGFLFAGIKWKKKSKGSLFCIVLPSLHAPSFCKGPKCYKCCVADEGRSGTRVLRPQVIPFHQRHAGLESEGSVMQTCRWWGAWEFLRQTWWQPSKLRKVVKQEARRGDRFWCWKANVHVTCHWVYLAWLVGFCQHWMRCLGLRTSRVIEQQGRQSFWS